MLYFPGDGQAVVEIPLKGDWKAKVERDLEEAKQEYDKVPEYTQKTETIASSRKELQSGKELTDNNAVKEATGKRGRGRPKGTAQRTSGLKQQTRSTQVNRVEEENAK
jgi:hypothetical protein